MLCNNISTNFVSYYPFTHMNHDKTDRRLVVITNQKSFDLIQTDRNDDFQAIL